MANDNLALVGKWIVKVQQWTWEYIFADGGKVTWRDPLNNEGGTGRWSVGPKSVNISWAGSSTTESFFRPIHPPNQEGWYDAPYFKGKYAARKVIAPAADPPTIGAPGDWFVTAFSGTTLSVVVGAGFTALTGSITFTNANGDKVDKNIGLYGPSIGLSYTPNIGNILSKLPGAQGIMKRFPRIAGIVTGKEEPFAQRVLLYLWAASPKMRAAITKFPLLRPALKVLLETRNSASYADENWWAKAIGLVYGKGSSPLKPLDFSGQCVCYALTLAAGPGNAGTYVLFFGLPSSWSPISDPAAFLDLMRIDAQSKGVAIISSASVSLGLPSLSAGAMVFWGEIV